MYTQEPPNRLRLRVVRLLHIIGLAVIDLQYVPKIRTEINTLRSDGGGDGTRHIFVYHPSFHASCSYYKKNSVHGSATNDSSLFGLMNWLLFA